MRWFDEMHVVWCVWVNLHTHKEELNHVAKGFFLIRIRLLTNHVVIFTTLLLHYTSHTVT